MEIDLESSIAPLSIVQCSLLTTLVVYEVLFQDEWHNPSTEAELAILLQQARQFLYSRNRISRRVKADLAQDR